MSQNHCVRRHITSSTYLSHSYWSTFGSDSCHRLTVSGQSDETRQRAPRFDVGRY